MDRDTLKLALWIALIVGALFMGYMWWMTGADTCERKGGVPVRGLGYAIVCIDKGAVK